MKPNPQLLLVDRNASDVKVVRDTLGSAGLEIHVRASASAALVAFHALEPDLVIVDSDVPGTSGAAVTREIKNTERGRATPVILMAEGPIEEAQRTQALSASGCSMLLQKPLLPQELIDTLTRFLPNAFLGKGASSDPEPRTPAPRRATGVRDPGTPFTADSFDEDSLGALLDQVFPTSDSGGLAQTIRTRSAQPPETREQEPSAPPAVMAPARPASAASAQPKPAPPAAPARAIPATPAPAAPPASAAAGGPASMASKPFAKMASASEPSTDDLLAEYLSNDKSAAPEEKMPTGLSVKDGETLDRIFDGPWSRAATAGDADIEPLEAASPLAPQKESHSASAKEPAVAPKESKGVKDAPGPAKEAQPAPAGDSFFGESFGDLGFDEPDSGAGVWQELEEALPPTPPVALSTFTAQAIQDAAKSEVAKPDGRKAESPRTESPRDAKKPAISSPASSIPVSPPAAPTVTASPIVSATPAKPASMTSAPVDASAKPAIPSTSYAKSVATVTPVKSSAGVISIPLSPMPSSAAPEPAVKPADTAIKPSKPPQQIETFPLARESAPARGASMPERHESKRSKKHKKSKGRRQDGPESIPLASADPAMSLPGAMASQSVAESVTSKPVSSRTERAPAAEMREMPMVGEMPLAGPAPRRTGAIVVVGAGLALAAAVAIFFVLNHSGDSDLRPTSPDRVRTPSANASIQNEEPAPESTELERETLPPVIPESEPPANAAGTPAATAPAAPASPSTPSGNDESKSPDSSVNQEPSSLGVKPPAGPAAARPAPATGSPGAPAMEASSAAKAPVTPAPGRPSAESSASRKNPGAMTPAAAHRTAAPSPSPSETMQNRPAPGSTAPGTGSSHSGSGPPAAASAMPADPHSGDPSSAQAPDPPGQVALGATMPTPAEASGAGIPEVDAVQSLASPVPLSRPAPTYPASALAMRTTGAVGLLVKVEADGSVSEVKVVRPAAPALNAAAVAAAQRWTYKPAHRGMDTVATWIEETVVFRLK